MLSSFPTVVYDEIGWWTEMSTVGEEKGYEDGVGQLKAQVHYRAHSQ